MYKIKYTKKEEFLQTLAPNIQKILTEFLSVFFLFNHKSNDQSKEIPKEMDAHVKIKIAIFSIKTGKHKTH